MSDELRRAHVNRDPEGRPIGCAVFLSDEQLEQLGFQLETIDEIEYRVEGGAVRLAKPVPTEVTESPRSTGVDAAATTGRVTQDRDRAVGGDGDG